MVAITGFTSERSAEIEGKVIVDARIEGGELILEQANSDEINAGSVNGGEQIPHTKVAQVTAPSPGSGTVSASFVALDSALAVSGFVKHRADTLLVVEYAGSIYNDNALGAYEVAVNLSGVNYIVATGFHNHGSKAGFVSIPGISAGTYTLSVLYRRTTAAGTVWDGMQGGRNCLKVTETF